MQSEMPLPTANYQLPTANSSLMNLTSPSQVKDWCIRNKFHPNRVLGQNFLIDKNALDAILDAAEIESGVRCLEIGPGLGVLTEGLLSRGCAVTAIEKDPVLADRLKGALGNPEGLTVLAGDALDFIKRGACDGFPLMVSNLPYQAGTRILIELAERVCPCAPSVERELAPPSNAIASRKSEIANSLPRDDGGVVATGGTRSCASIGPTPFSVERELDPPVQCAAAEDSRPPANESMPKWPNAIASRKSEIVNSPPETMVALVQTEVAERLAAHEGSKVRGLAGVRVQFDYDVSIVRKVSASCFWPRPEIGSTVVKLVRHHRNDGEGADVRRVFRMLTKQAFEHRRKQLGSIFKGVIESSARAEDLSNEEWLELSRNIEL